MEIEAFSVAFKGTKKLLMPNASIIFNERKAKVFVRNVYPTHGDHGIHSVRLNFSNSFKSSRYFSFPRNDIDDKIRALFLLV